MNIVKKVRHLYLVDNIPVTWVKSHHSSISILRLRCIQPDKVLHSHSSTNVVSCSALGAESRDIRDRHYHGYMVNLKVLSLT